MTDHMKTQLPLTRQQKDLRAKHGNPAEFARAVYACVPGDISMEEARTAVDNYTAEWTAAGNEQPDNYKAVIYRVGAMEESLYGHDPDALARRAEKRLNTPLFSTEAVEVIVYHQHSKLSGNQASWTAIRHIKAKHDSKTT